MKTTATFIRPRKIIRLSLYVAFSMALLFTLLVILLVIGDTGRAQAQTTVDGCVVPVSGDGKVTGSWSSDCISGSRSGSYARFYTFTLDESRDVRITLESQVDTYLYVREGEGRDGRVVHEDNDHDNAVFSLASSTDSGISENLTAGPYTIEATTITAGETGDFTLVIRGTTDASDSLFNRYDTNGNGQIDKSEALAAINDYLFGEGVTKEQALGIINFYLFGPPTPASPIDRAALEALYNATDGPNWTNNDNWLSDAPIEEWDGVYVGAGGRVTELHLDGRGLSGEIPPELGNLSNLTNLYLYRNKLRGEIPPELGNLTNLKDLFLYVNQLSGEIPSELGNLSNLTRLYLLANRLSGEIPPELGNLTNLTFLSLSINQLSGEIPSELGNLSSLEHLAFTRNQLSGDIPPELGALSNLRNLHIRDNQLSGDMPSEILDIAGLRNMLLWGNDLQVTVPDHPSETAILTALHNATNGSEWTDSRNWGAEPVFTWYGVGIDTSGRVTSLHLRRNQLSGQIPSELGSLSNLLDLDMRQNDLTGEIPAELAELPNLEILRLVGTDLSGCIPARLLEVPENDLSDLGLPTCADGN